MDKGMTSGCVIVYTLTFIVKEILHMVDEPMCFRI